MPYFACKHVLLSTSASKYSVEKSVVIPTGKLSQVNTFVVGQIRILMHSGFAVVH